MYETKPYTDAELAETRRLMDIDDPDEQIVFNIYRWLATVDEARAEVERLRGALRRIMYTVDTTLAPGIALAAVRKSRCGKCGGDGWVGEYDMFGNYEQVQCDECPPATLAAEQEGGA